MGCDYYIEKQLNIYFNNDDYLLLTVEKDRGYYNHNYDEDDDEYDIKVNKYKTTCLTSTFEPIIKYSNNNFNKPTTEQKYKFIIEKFIKTKYLVILLKL
jgi:hypothetical protein